MDLINLIIVNLKRYLKNPFILLMTFLFPVAIVLGSDLTDSGSSYEIGILNLDKGSYSYELEDNLKENYKIIQCEGEVEDNFSKIEDSKIVVLYVIEEGFQNKLESGEIPKIKAYKNEASSGMILAEDTIDKFIKNKLKDNIDSNLKDNFIETIVKVDESKDNSDYVMNVIMIGYFMMLGGSMIAQDIIKLKKQKVLKRSLATANSDGKIIGGMFIASFIIQTILSFLAYVINTTVTGAKNSNMLIAFLAIALCSLVCTAVITACIRWLKNPVFANLVMIIFSILSFGLAVINVQLLAIEKVPEAILRISGLSPLYWILQIVEKGEFLLPILILLLMAGVFFTAGSFRLREFVKND